jgi:hypothetical protein
MDESLEELLTTQVSDLKSFYAKVEQLERHNASEHPDVRNLIAIRDLLEQYVPQIQTEIKIILKDSHASLPSLEKFYDEVEKQTGMNLTTSEGKEGYLRLTGLPESTLPELPKKNVKNNKNKEKDTTKPENTLQLPPDITFEKVNGIILPPDPKAPETGSGADQQKPVTENRIAQVLHFFNEEGINIPYNKQLLIGDDPSQKEHRRKTSYVVVTILGIGQIAVNDYGGEALYFIAPPQDDIFWTTTGKEELLAHKQAYVKCIPFDKQDKWKWTIIDSIIESSNISAQGVQQPDDEVDNNASRKPKRNAASYKKEKQAIIESLSKNFDETRKAIQEAFATAYDKPASTITDGEIAETRTVEISLPDGQLVEITSSVLCHELLKNKEKESLAVLLESPNALTAFARRRIFALLSDSETAEKTEDAIHKAAKEAFKEAFSEQGLKNITVKEIKELNPELCIVVPGRQPIYIGAASLEKALNRNKQGFHSFLLMLKKPQAMKEHKYKQLSEALLDPEATTHIISQIGPQLADIVSISRSKDIITFSFPSKDGKEVDISVSCKELYNMLQHKSNRYAFTLPEIRTRYQEQQQAEQQQAAQTDMALMAYQKQSASR